MLGTHYGRAQDDAGLIASIGRRSALILQVWWCFFVRYRECDETGLITETYIYSESPRVYPRVRTVNLFPLRMLHAQAGGVFVGSIFRTLHP